MTSGLRDLLEVVEDTEDATEDDFWWRLWIGDLETLMLE
jgi:hypothetical protein